MGDLARIQALPDLETDDECCVTKHKTIAIEILEHKLAILSIEACTVYKYW